MTDFDREILKLVQVSLGASDVEILHPMYMYRLFYRFWKSQMSINLVETFSLFQPLPNDRRVGCARHAAEGLRRGAVLLQRVVPRHGREPAICHVAPASG